VDACTPAELDDLLAYLKVRRAGRWERWQRQAEDGFRRWRAYSSRGEKLMAGSVLLGLLLGVVGGIRALVRRRRPTASAQQPG